MCQEDILRFLEKHPDSKFTRTQIEEKTDVTKGRYIEPIGKLRKWGDVNWEKGEGARGHPCLYWHKPDEGDSIMSVSPLPLYKKDTNM